MSHFRVLVLLLFGLVVFGPNRGHGLNAAGDEVKLRKINERAQELHDQGSYSEAHQYFREAYGICRKLYPSSEYLQGHSDLARSLNNMGMVLESQGKYAQANQFHLKSLEMRKRLYPASKFRQGHPDVAQSLDNVDACSNRRMNWRKRVSILSGQ